MQEERFIKGHLPPHIHKAVIQEGLISSHPSENAMGNCGITVQYRFFTLVFFEFTSPLDGLVQGVLFWSGDIHTRSGKGRGNYSRQGRRSEVGCFWRSGCFVRLNVNSHGCSSIRKPREEVHLRG